MFDEFMSVIQSMGETLIKIVPISIALGLAFAVLTVFFACNPDHRPWWRKRELVTDICYWFFVPLFARVFRWKWLIAPPLGAWHATTE